MSANLKPVPELEQQELSDDEAALAIADHLEQQAKDDAPDKPGELQEDDGEEGIEPETLVTLPDGEQVTPDDLLAKMMYTVEIDGEEVEVPGDRLLREGMKAWQGKTSYERDSAEIKKEREELYPFVKLVAQAKSDPGFAAHIRQYFAGVKHHDVDPELRFTDRELIQIQAADPERAARILQKRATWLEQEQARQYHQQRVDAEQARLWNEAAGYYEQQAESFIDARHGKGSFRNEANGVLSYLNQMGMSQQEIQNIIDPRLQSIAFDAFKFNQLHSQMTGTRNSIASKRKKLKPAKSMTGGTGAGSAHSPQRSQAKLYAKAVKTQRSDDWANALVGRLKLD